MKAIRLLAIVAVALCMGGCTARNTPQEQQVSVTPKVREFQKIEINTKCEVEYTQGNETYVRITGDADAVCDITTTVSNGTLTINRSLKNRILGLQKEPKVKVYITSPDLVGVSLKGSGDFCAKGKIDTDTLELNLSGAGDIDCHDIICDEISVSLKGAGDIDLHHVVCQRSAISLYGAGDVEASISGAVFSEIELKGTGDIDVAFDKCQKAICTVYGVGDIQLEGKLRHLEKRVKGIGSIDTKKLSVTD